MKLIGQRRSNLNDPQSDGLQVWQAEDVQPILDENGCWCRNDIYARLVFDSEAPLRVGQHCVFSGGEWNAMLLVLGHRDPAELLAPSHYE